MIKMMIAVNSKDEGKRLLEFFGQKPDIEVVGVEYDGQGGVRQNSFLKTGYCINEYDIAGIGWPGYYGKADGESGGSKASESDCYFFG
ncbi:unknown [Clostridium sp. CAG:632]|nr:unknown [Clostridium sp. CAG:632]